MPQLLLLNILQRWHLSRFVMQEPRGTCSAGKVQGGGNQDAPVTEAIRLPVKSAALLGQVLQAACKPLAE